MRPDMGCADVLWSLCRGTPAPARLLQALSASPAGQSSADLALGAPQTTALPAPSHHRATARHTIPLSALPQ
jgi:hypothetical protein